MTWVAIAVAVVLVGGAVLWAVRSGGDGGSPAPDADAAEPRPGAAHAYRLAYRDTGHYGQGYIIVRNQDGKVYRWRTPEDSDGLMALGVAGELDHKENLQSPAFDPGRWLSLVREPDSPHDEEGHATAITDAEETMKVGHVPAERAEEVARTLDEGVELRCLSMWEVVQLEERVSLRVLLIGPDADLDLSAVS